MIPAAFYRHLFGPSTGLETLGHLFALVQRQAVPADRLLFDAALGLATNTLRVNLRYIPVAHLEPRGSNGTTQWWITDEHSDVPVTSVATEYLTAVIEQLRSLRAPKKSATFLGGRR